MCDVTHIYVTGIQFQTWQEYNFSTAFNLLVSPDLCQESRVNCVLQCVVGWCSVLHCAAVCCSVLQCVAVCFAGTVPDVTGDLCVVVCCSVLQCVAKCCKVLQCVALCCSVTLCVRPVPGVMGHLYMAVCCIVCCSVYCIVLQCNAVFCCMLNTHMHDACTHDTHTMRTRVVMCCSIL